MTGVAPRSPDLRIALMGAGRFGCAMLPKLNTAAGCSVGVIASRTRAKADRVAHALGLGAAGGCTYEDLLRRDDIDAVYLATPNHMHAPWAIRLLEAGKHVLVEKPLSATRDGALGAYMAAERCGRVLAEGFMYAHHPQTLALTRTVQRALTGEGDPVIGRLTHIAAHRNFPVRAESHDTRLSHAMHGGALMDLGCYALSFPVIVSGHRLTDLRAAGKLAPPLEGEALGVDASAAWTARLEGAPVTVSGSCSIMEGGLQTIELVGHLGTLSTSWAWSPDEGDQALRFHPSDGGPEQRISLEEPADRARAQFAAFARACRGEGPVVPSPLISIHIAELLESALRQVGVVFGEPTTVREHGGADA
jgi:predicted dehydrogenase